MSEELNQTIEEASLDNLHDIILPEPMGLFPLAPGWIIVFILIAALGLHYLWKWYVHYEMGRYKREAMSELQTYTAKSREEMLSLLALAKRVAIAAYGREAIATLQGDHWWDFMEAHSKVKVDKVLRDTIDQILYDESAKVDMIPQNEIYTLIKTWIKTHKAVKHV